MTKKLIAIALVSLVSAACLAEDTRIWNGGMPVGNAAWCLSDSTPRRLIKGGMPVGNGLVNFRDGKICSGNMPGTPIWIYERGKLWKGHLPVGAPACEFRDNKLIVDAVRTVGVFTPHNRRFFKGNMPVGNPAFTWSGNWPEAMLVYMAYCHYLKAGGASGAKPAEEEAMPANGVIPPERIFRVRDGAGKVVCTYALGNIWDGDTTKGEPAWNFDGKTKTFRKGGARSGAPFATFKGRYLLKGDGSDPAQYYSEFLMMCDYEPGKTNPDAFGCWDSTDFNAFHRGFRTYKDKPQGEVLLSFDRTPKSSINAPTKHFIVWKYLMDK